ncbi:sensor histidine kinase [Sediminicola sp. 1XM1-17]|uniref:sensor histidine kinase n=1 Tax=Sediminicola sp. 1XM1-17 TaxID=3127702 RepID=UPI0030785032
MSILFYVPNLKQYPLKSTTNFKGELPLWIIVGTIGISIVPLILTIFGFDFGYESPPIDMGQLSSMTPSEFENTIQRSLGGSILHSIMEWSAVAFAFGIGSLSLIQYRITGNPVTSIVGIALFCAGSIDAFHALAATNLIHSDAEIANFSPFTWALSRLFNSLILLIGVGIFLVKNKLIPQYRKSNTLVAVVGVTFVSLSYIIIQLCVQSEVFPVTVYPDNFISRPYDILPLIIYSILGLFVLPAFHKSEKSVFTESLMWSMIPALATQLHMTFGSIDLYDHHFNIGHFLKIISYLIPFAGLGIFYIKTYRVAEKRLVDLDEAHKLLTLKNQELEQYTHIASHDLQEPLRSISSFTELLEDRYQEKLDPKGQQYIQFIKKSSDRMYRTIKILMDYSRVGTNLKPEWIDCNEVLEMAKQDLSFVINDTNASFKNGTLPKIYGGETDIRLLFQNLIANSLKFKREGVAPIIDISATSNDTEWLFEFRDNGIGIPQEELKDIFIIYKRLGSSSKKDGHGIGLSHCKKIVELHGGKIWVDSEPNKGSSFFFTIPMKDEMTVGS